MTLGEALSIINEKTYLVNQPDRKNYIVDTNGKKTPVERGTGDYVALVSYAKEHGEDFGKSDKIIIGTTTLSFYTKNGALIATHPLGMSGTTTGALKQGILKPKDIHGNDTGLTPA